MSDLAILRWLLEQSQPENTSLSLSAWKTQFDVLSADWEQPIERALIGGWIADRTGYAFAAGYQSALRRLFPDLPETVYAALCVTEAEGNHPRAIKTQLIPEGDGYLLEGEKSFVTHAREAEVLLVAATVGQDENGRNKLRLVRLDTDTPQVTITPLPELPFVPEISHGVVRFESARIEADMLLPGDGYAHYVKPFRTVEDLHVFGAVMAYLLRVVRGMDQDRLAEQVLALIAAVIPLAGADPGAPHIHIAISGLRRQMNALITQIEAQWETAGGDDWVNWQRDKRLLLVAEKVRLQRRANAWAALRQR